MLRSAFCITVKFWNGNRVLFHARVRVPASAVFILIFRDVWAKNKLKKKGVFLESILALAKKDEFGEDGFP